MSAGNEYATFYNWIKGNGGRIHEQIKIDTKDERGLFARDAIQSHTALAVIPRSLVVNIQHPDLATISTDTERQALIVFLIREYSKGDGSTWFPWIKLLNIDQEANDLLNMKMHLFNCVEHSTLGQALTDRYQQLQEEYEQLSQTENEPLSLVPFIDFANHSLEASARWFIDDETHDLILRSERTLKPNEEITISYGSKSNEELLYLYGFASPNNPNDRVTLPVSLESDDVLLQDKLQLIRELKLPPRLTLDCNGRLTAESSRLGQILSAQSQTAIHEDHKHDIPYLLNLLNDYLTRVNMCADEEKFVRYYLESQKLIVQKAIEYLKSIESELEKTHKKQ